MRDYQDKQMLVRRILSGKLFYLQDEDFIEFKDPTTELLYKADIYYKKVLDKNLVKFESLEELIKSAIELGLWNIEKDKSLKELKKEHKEIKNRFIRSKHDLEKSRFLSKMNQTEKEIRNLNKQKYQFMGISAEFRSQRSRKNFLIKNICDYETIDKYGKDFLVAKYFDENHLEEEDIREIARSEPFRSMWNTSKKTSTSLIQNISESLTEYQQFLFYWANVYDYIFENPDTPDGLDVNNDIAVDKWLATESKTKNKNNNNFNLNGDVNGVETFKFAKNQNEASDLYQDAGRETQKHVKEITTAVSKGEKVEDQELPSVQRDLRAALIKKSTQ